MKFTIMVLELKRREEDADIYLATLPSARFIYFFSRIDVHTTAERLSNLSSTLHTYLEKLKFFARTKLK
jgi:hypothetical protein